MPKARGLFMLLLPALLAAPAALPAAEGAKRDVVLNSTAFLTAHPDLRWRREGMLAYDQGRLELAADYFRRAARYADKPSQAMYAEMLWEGRGVEMDRPLAYAWMDLAAERAYPTFLGKRERYWAELDEAGRQRAMDVGQGVYAEYGDVVAKRRLEAILERAAHNVTGSRVGFVGRVDVLVPGPNGTWERIRGNEYYARQFWQPQQYWHWQDQTWKAAGPGRVEVRKPEQIEDRPPADDAPPPAP